MIIYRVKDLRVLAENDEISAHGFGDRDLLGFHTFDVY